MCAIDVSLLLRAFSIFAIVASHFGLIHLTGGRFTLSHSLVLTSSSSPSQSSALTLEGQKHSTTIRS